MNLERILMMLALFVWVSYGTFAQPPDGKKGRPGGNAQGGSMSLAFSALDANSDGLLDDEEIKVARQSLLKLDKDADGRLSRDEVGRRPGGSSPTGNGGASSPILAIFDTNQDEAIDSKELAHASIQLRKRDLDLDGKVSRAEFGGGPRPMQAGIDSDLPRNAGKGMQREGRPPGGKEGARSRFGSRPGSVIDASEPNEPSQGPGGLGANVPGVD